MVAASNVAPTVKQVRAAKKRQRDAEIEAGPPMVNALSLHHNRSQGPSRANTTSTQFRRRITEPSPPVIKTDEKTMRLKSKMAETIYQVTKLWASISRAKGGKQALTDRRTDLFKLLDKLRRLFDQCPSNRNHHKQQVAPAPTLWGLFLRGKGIAKVIVKNSPEFHK